MKTIYRRLFVIAVFSAIVFMVTPQKLSAQMVAAKANAALYAAMTPNLSLEFATGEKTSADFTILGHYNPYGQESRLIALQSQFKYWFGGRPMVREYIGALALISSYDMTWKHTVYEGNSAGIGATFGYVLPLGKRWNVEFSGGIGLVGYHQRKYSDSITKEELERLTSNSAGFRVVPVNLGITFAYIIR